MAKPIMHRWTVRSGTSTGFSLSGVNRRWCSTPAATHSPSTARDAATRANLGWATSSSSGPTRTPRYFRADNSLHTSIAAISSFRPTRRLRVSTASVCRLGGRRERSVTNRQRRGLRLLPSRACAHGSRRRCRRTLSRNIEAHLIFVLDYATCGDRPDFRCRRSDATAVAKLATLIEARSSLARDGAGSVLRSGRMILPATAARSGRDERKTASGHIGEMSSERSIVDGPLTQSTGQTPRRSHSKRSWPKRLRRSRNR